MEKSKGLHVSLVTVMLVTIGFLLGDLLMREVSIQSQEYVVTIEYLDGTVVEVECSDITGWSDDSGDVHLDGVIYPLRSVRRISKEVVADE